MNISLPGKRTSSCRLCCDSRGVFISKPSPEIGKEGSSIFLEQQTFVLTFILISNMWDFEIKEDFMPFL